MTSWQLLSVMFRLGVAAVTIFKLLSFYDSYKRSERIGLGIAGGCALMTISVIVQGPGGPFDDWAGAMFAGGVFVCWTSRAVRQWRHERANRQQREIALDRLARKAKP